MPVADAMEMEEAVLELCRDICRDIVPNWDTATARNKHQKKDRE